MSKVFHKLKYYNNLKRFIFPKYFCNRKISTEYESEEDESKLSPILESSPIKENPIKSVHKTKSQQPRILIIGAGISGLSAADTLIRNGFNNIQILEASERYGGRIYSVPLGDSICELGAKWVNVSDAPNSLYNLIKKIGMKESLPSQHEKLYMTSKGELISGDTVQSATWAFSNLITRADLKKVSENEFQNSRNYIQNQADEMANRLFQKDLPLVKKIFASLYRDLTNFVGCDLSSVSVAQLIKIAKSYANPVSVNCGLQEITRKLANSVRNEQLLLGKPVHYIRWSKLQPDECPYVTCLDGSKYTADHVICTLPLGVLKTFHSILFVPNLPEEKSNALNKLGVGSTGRIYFEYQNEILSWFMGTLKPIWSVIELEQKTDWSVDITEICLIPESKRVLEIKIGGSSSEDVERCNDQTVANKVTHLLRKFMKNDNLTHPKNVIRSFWSTDSRFLGGQPYLSVYSDENNINDLAKPLRTSRGSQAPALLFAGDATVINGFGTLDGARQSGIREARRIINYYTQERQN